MEQQFVKGQVADLPAPMALALVQMKVATGLEEDVSVTLTAHPEEPEVTTPSPATKKRSK